MDPYWLFCWKLYLELPLYVFAVKFRAACRVPRWMMELWGRGTHPACLASPLSFPQYSHKWTTGTFILCITDAYYVFNQWKGYTISNLKCFGTLHSPATVCLRPESLRASEKGWKLDVLCKTRLWASIITIVKVNPANKIYQLIRHKMLELISYV